MVAAKKSNRQEQYKKKIMRRRVILLSVFFVVLLLCICLFTPLFGISEITVTQNVYLSQEEVIETSGIEKGENVFRFSTRRVKKKLTALPYVVDAKIHRKFPAKVVIELTEAKPDLIFDQTTEFVVATKEGRVLEVTDDVTHLTSPICYGIALLEKVPAQRFVAKDNALLDTALLHIGLFYETPFWHDIDEFYVGDPANFIVVLKSGMKITFGTVENTESLTRKIRMLTQILSQVTQTERSYLDLTTDKGYFGEYTEEELLEMEERKDKGNMVEVLTGEETGEDTAKDDKTDGKTNENDKNNQESAPSSSRKKSSASTENEDKDA